MKKFIFSLILIIGFIFVLGFFETQNEIAKTGDLIGTAPVTEWSKIGFNDFRVVVNDQGDLSLDVVKFSFFGWKRGLKDFPKILPNYGFYFNEEGAVFSENKGAHFKEIYINF